MLDNPIATHYPDQNILLQAAKGRVSGYLNSIRPLKFAPKLAFDSEPDNRDQKKSYKSALDIANKPLSILGKIQKGTVQANDIKHFTSMYPEMHDHLSKKITEKIMEAQLKGQKPNHKVRQGLSMFLGAPLSGEMKPANIMAAQATFQMQQAQPAPAPKKKLSAIGKTDDHHLTAIQAATGRQQKQ
jgi:hypothetical protein